MDQGLDSAPSAAIAAASVIVIAAVIAAETAAETAAGTACLPVHLLLADQPSIWTCELYQQHRIPHHGV